MLNRKIQIMNYRKMSLKVCLILLLTWTIGYTQWKATNGPLGGDIRTILTMGDRVIVGIVGGGIYQSLDSCASWFPSNTGLTDYYIFSLAACDSNIYVSEFGGVYISTDRGYTWSARSSGLPAGSIYTLLRRDTNIFAGSQSYGLYLSTDQGNSWNQAGLQSKSIFTLVADSQSIIASTVYSGLFRSTDNGISWIPSDSGLSPSIVYSVASVMGNFLAGTDSGIFVSSNHGSSWFRASVPEIAPFVSAFHPIGSTIYAGGKTVLSSTDSGRSWSTLTQEPFRYQISSMASISNSLLAGTRHGLLISSDGGSAWTESNSGIVGTRINRMQESEGILYSIADNVKLVRSSDKGLHWEVVNIPFISRNLTDILLCDSSIFITTFDSGIYRSTDKGYHWVSINNGLSTMYITSIINRGEYIFAGTLDSGVFYTMNRGDQWIRTASDASSPSSLHVEQLLLSSNHLFMRSSSEYLFMYLDSIASWTRIDGGYEFPPIYFYRIAASSTCLYASSNHGFVYSLDAGISWTRDTSSIQQIFALSSLVSTGNNFLVGTYDGKVFLSEHVGQTWKDISDGLPKSYMLSFTQDSADLYVGTFGFGVWRRPLTEIITNVDDKRVSSNPVTFALLQNYPNPFNPTTEIRFMIQDEQFTTLRVYDLLGREVTMLVNEVKQPGEYMVIWIADGIPSGVYFCRMTAGLFSEVKKIIIVK